MRKLVLSTAALAALVAVPHTGFAQGFYVGPGGVGFDDGRRGYYEERRGGYREMCRELRRACLYKEELGDEGRGNCRRYRARCG
jgi:hypothetical protein